MMDEIKRQLQRMAEEERRKKRKRSLVRTIIFTVLVCVILLQIVFGLSIVEGDSMEPGISDSDIVVFCRVLQEYEKGDIVIAEVEQGEVIKRIEYIKDGQIYLVGDNDEKSIDSRDFGLVSEKNVIGKVVYVIER